MTTGSLPPTPTCFTYEPPTDPDLQQGDILAKTAGIQEILEKVHPYYKNDSYTNFIVLTQSCDLVRRDDGPPKSRYITLAAVRPLHIVIERELEKYQSPIAKKAMVCKEGAREKLEFFVQQLLNNNSSEFFYLHPEPQLDFSEPSCAFLRLSVSIKSSEHYETCYASRILSLDQMFQAKLGWLVGSMYSRVGTEDWVPNEATKEKFEEMIKDILEGHCDFVDGKKLKLAEKSPPPDLETKTKNEIRDYINAKKVPQKREELLDAVDQVVKELGKVQTPDESRQLRQRLSIHPKFREFTR